MHLLNTLAVSQPLVNFMLVETYRTDTQPDLPWKFVTLEHSVERRPTNGTTLKNFRDFDDSNSSHNTPIFSRHHSMPQVLLQPHNPLIFIDINNQ